MKPRTIWVKVSTELLADLSEWSDPVQVLVIAEDDGTHEMIFRMLERGGEEPVDAAGAQPD